MRIAILSSNPRHNYGGILQSYALKKVLERMGHDVRVICKERHMPEFGIQQIIRWPYRLLKKVIRGKNVWIFSEHHYNKINPIRCRYVDKFVDNYLSPIFIHSIKEIKEGEFDAIVVGSDQVWRPKFYKGTYCTKLKDAFLDFAKGWDIKRIAYAASFGVDKWEYTDKETKKCAQLLKNFDAVSVREISGCKLCKEHFGLDVIQLCDPALLLDKEDYASLIFQEIPKSSGDLFVYCLDKNDELEKLVGKLSKEKGLTPFYFGSQRWEVLAPVEIWLQCFKDAKLIITDSFHGCVFALIYHKPFFVFCNDIRGRARFETLLDIFKQTERALESADDYDDGYIYPPLDNIENIIAQLRAESYQFFKAVL